jgi:hypothetical protein
MRKKLGSNYKSKFKTKKSLNNNYFNETNQENNLSSNSIIKNITEKNELKDNYISFNLNRIDDYTGFFTTQQLNNINFSDFENHVFFDSAVEKVNYTFKKIINEYPYDEEEFLLEKYKKDICGYTNYILEKVIPKNIGYIVFDGDNKVEVKDSSGSIFKNSKNLNKDNIGLLSPDLKSFTFDFWIKPTSILNNQIVFQKILENEGYTCYITNDGANNLKLNMLYTTNTGFIYTNVDIKLNLWCHLNINIAKVKTRRHFEISVNGKKISTESVGSIAFKKNTENFKYSTLNIGYGQLHNNIYSQEVIHNILDVNAFNGCIDNFRIYSKKLNQKEIKFSKNNDVFSSSSIILNLTFNEPSGVYINNNITLDSSGNRLDGVIKNISGSNFSNIEIDNKSYRQSKTDLDYHIKYENKINHPVRFPSFQKTIDIQKELLKKAKRYDKFNPNVFWKLFPETLFTMSSEFENNQQILVDNSSYKQNENSTKIIVPENNILISIIEVWSRFFDQLKMYVDSFTEIINLDYDSLNKNETLNMFLPAMVNKMGFEFKDLLPSSLKTKLDNKNLTHEEIYSEKSIRKIQDELWKRFLINSNDYIRSKGTKKSIKSVFNSMGIDYNKFITIREFSGKNNLNSKSNYVELRSKLNYLDFSSSKMLKNFNTSFYGSEIYPINKFVLEIKKVSSDSSTFDDNWSIESMVKYNENLQNIHGDQSLLRIDRNTNWSSNLKYFPLINLIYYKNSKTINLKIKEGKSVKNGNEKLRIDEFIQATLSVENIDLMNGCDYYFCIQREVKDSKNIQYNLFIYQSYSSNLKIIKKSIGIKTTPSISFEGTENIDAIRIGNTNPYKYFHNESYPLIETNFEGKLFGVRLWKKLLIDSEIKNHSHDFLNFGVENPNNFFDSSEDKNLVVNFNMKEKFVGINEEENVVIDSDYFNFNNSFVFLKNNKINANEVLEGNTYQISEALNTDFTNIGSPDNEMNTYFLASSNGPQLQSRSAGKVYVVSYIPRIKIDSNYSIKDNFESLGEIVKSTTKNIKTSNIKIDQPVNYKGININYFEEEENNKDYNIKSTEDRFNVSTNFELVNDLRCSVDFSATNFIDRKISNTISDNSFINGAISKSSNRYEGEYRDLYRYREDFFNVFEDKVDFKKLYQVYKYFDNILTDLISQSIPSRVNYLGFNFVFESHALERHKYMYKMSENRLPVVEKAFMKTSNKNIINKDGKKTAIEYRNNSKTQTINTSLHR